MKALDSFLNYLELNKLYKVTPNTYTERELMSFAHSKGYIFSKKSLQSRIKRFTDKPAKLTPFERSWIPQNDFHQE